MRNSNRKFLLCAISLFLLFSFVSAQSMVLSPTNGVWANYQSLVLQLPENYEAYYSLSGGNPLESGFAYDGPVLLELDGNVKIDIAVVDDNSITQSYTVDYSVNLQDSLSYLSDTSGQPTHIVDGLNSISLPQHVRYSLGNSAIFSAGEVLSMDSQMIFERYLPFIVNDGPIPYRYILQLGNSENGDSIIDISQNTIEIDDWNYITFLAEAPIVYSIDDEPLRLTRSGKIFVDRTQDHELKWKQSTSDDLQEFQSIVLPKKPEVLGLPKTPAVNHAIELTLSDARYDFAYDVSNNEKSLSKNYFIDTLHGDAFGFSDNIDIYLDGVRHGSISPTFIVDKIAPSAPVLTASNNSGYARENVTITVQANDTVYYYIPFVQNSKTGFLTDEYLNDSNIQYQNNDYYSQLASGATIKFTNNSGAAQVLEVYAFCSDYAGNTSDIVHYKTVVDPYNYYLSKDETSKTSLELGTIDNPFTSFLQLQAVLNKASNQNIYINGVFEDISTLTFTKDTTIYATDSTRLIFAPGESLYVDSASLSIEGGSIEQINPETAATLQNTLLYAKDATLSLNNCEFAISGGLNSNCIILENSSAQIFDSGITVQTQAYGSGLKATNSVVLSQGNRFTLLSETTIGMSLVETSVQIRDSSFTGIGPLSRSLEFIDSNYSIANNRFVFRNSSESISSHLPAIWADDSTVQKSLANNSFDGFTQLVARQSVE